MKSSKGAEDLFSYIVCNFTLKFSKKTQSFFIILFIFVIGNSHVAVTFSYPQSDPFVGVEISVLNCICTPSDCYS